MILDDWELSYLMIHGSFHSLTQAAEQMDLLTLYSLVTVRLILKNRFKAERLEHNDKNTRTQQNPFTDSSLVLEVDKD